MIINTQTRVEQAAPMARPYRTQTWGSAHSYFKRDDTGVLLGESLLRK